MVPAKRTRLETGPHCTGEKMTYSPLKLGSRLLFAAASLAIIAACSPEPAKPAEPAAPAAAAAKPSDDQAWPAAAVADPATAGFTAEGLAALDARMAKSVADHDVAGMVTILAKGGEVAQFKAYGVQSGDPATGAPMTINSMFRIYSMSKPITGTAMMQLYEQGKWQLDDPVTKYVPELASLKVLTWGKDGKPVIKNGKPVLADPKSPPTMRQLMSHTAGFGYGLCCDDPVNAAFRDQAVLASKDLEEMMKKIEGIPLLYDPGTKWSYSAAVDIQGYIVQKLSGQKFGDYLKEHVFTPLGMNDTSFFVTEANKPRFTDVYHWDKDKKVLVKNEDRPDRPGFTDPNRLESGGGGLVSTTHDYARFAQMFLGKGTLAGNLVTASPIGDMAPVLLALDAGVVLARRSGDGVARRTLPLADFFVDYRKTAMAEDEILEWVIIPAPPAGVRRIFDTFKVSKRRELDIAIVSAGLCVDLDAAGNVQNARFGWGGVAAKPSRSPKTEELLRGKPWTAETVDAACAVLAGESTYGKGAAAAWVPGPAGLSLRGARVRLPDGREISGEGLSPDSP